MQADFLIFLSVPLGCTLCYTLLQTNHDIIFPAVASRPISILIIERGVSMAMLTLLISIINYLGQLLLVIAPVVVAWWLNKRH